MAKSNHFDVLVVGLGAMGAATLYHLAKSGLRVCGLESRDIAHDEGSSHGALRMIRKAYFEHPDYIPLLNRAYELWESLQDDGERELMVLNGLMISGAPESSTIRGLEACYAEHDLPHVRLSNEEARARFPAFSFPENHVAFVDPDGGYLYPETCVRRFVELAEDHGAELRIHHKVDHWRSDGQTVYVNTESEEFQADRLVLTLGPWAAEALRETGIELKVLRKVQLWYTSPEIEAYSEDNVPPFAFDMDDGFYYGFPAIGDDGLKVAEHTGGGITEDPDQVDRALNEGDETRARSFLRRIFPQFAPELKRFSVCMYSTTPDEHFVLDFHPSHSNVVFGAGFSGHGFKFAPVVGEILAQLATEGKTDYPIEFLRLARLL